MVINYPTVGYFRYCLLFMRGVIYSYLINFVYMIYCSGRLQVRAANSHLGFSCALEVQVTNSLSTADP